MERKVVELENLSFRDALSGMANRRYAEMRLAHAVEEVQTFGRQYAVFMVDLNGFKAANDRYGHAVGDELIRVLGRTLTECVRTEDLVARWGGDEFLILASGMAGQQLESRAERLRSMVQASIVVKENMQVAVTAAVGATMIQPTDSSASVVERADEQMYADKNRSRKARLSQIVESPLLLDSVRFSLSLSHAALSMLQTVKTEYSEDELPLDPAFAALMEDCKEINTETDLIFPSP